MDEDSKDFHGLTSTQRDADTDQPNQKDNTKEHNWKNICQWLKKDQEYRQNIFKTAILCWSFFSLGLMTGQIGPSLIDLQEITQTTLTKISATLTASGIGYLTGTIVTGVISDRIDINLICFLSCFGAALSTAAIPWCSIYEVLILISLIRGIMNGLQDTAANSLLLQLWKKDCSSYMQTLHFSWACGTIVSPLFTAQFLSKASTKSLVSLSFNLSSSQSLKSFHTSSQNTLQDDSYLVDAYTYSINPFTNQSSYVDTSSSDSKLYVPFSITAVFFISAAVFFMMSYCQSTKTTQVAKEPKKERSDDIKLPRLMHYMALVNLSLLMMVSVAVETVLGGLIATFSVKRLNWSKLNGAYLTSVFSAAFTVGRFTGIFVVKFISSSKTIIIYTTILTVTVAVFLVCSLFMFDVGIWICVAVAGIAVSVMFPGILTWAEDDFFRMKRRITCCILVCSSLGWMLNILLVGSLMDNVTPMFYCYVCLGDCLLVVCLYISANKLSRKVKKYSHNARKGIALVV